MGSRKSAFKGLLRVRLERIRFCSRAPRLDLWISSQHAIHNIEFYGHHPGGFAGACDALLDIDQQSRPFIVDWKTSGKSIHASMESQQ